jgi:hypothetical protein
MRARRIIILLALAVGAFSTRADDAYPTEP